MTSLENIDWSQPLWLGITVNTDAEMTPRQLITSVPKAILAEQLAADAFGPIHIAGENVGIGTPYPQNQLHVYNASGNTVLGLQADNPVGTPILTWHNGGKVWKAGIDSADGGKFKISEDGNAWDNIGTGVKLTIDPANGNVGIGTTNPTAKLGIDGTVRIHAIANKAPYPCEASVTGTLYYNIDDALCLCTKSSDGSYAWTKLAGYNSANCP